MSDLPYPAFQTILSLHSLQVRNLILPSGEDFERLNLLAESWFKFPAGCQYRSCLQTWPRGEGAPRKLPMCKKL